MLTGVVARFNGEKGWGFVRADAGGPDVMVHVNELLPGEDADWLRQGARVSYDERSGPRGLRAVNVRVLAEETQQRTDFGDVLTATQFRDEVTAIMTEAVSRLEKVARRHGWIWLGYVFG